MAKTTFVSTTITSNRMNIIMICSKALLRLAVLGATLAAVLPVDSFAEEPMNLDEEKAREESREYFKQGKNAFKAGDYDAARELFQKAWARYDKESLIALALAKAYDRATQLEKALIYYDHFLRLAPVNKDYVQDRELTVARAAAIRDILKSRPGILKFKGLPSGAKLEVDGKPCDVDAAGEVKVSAGTHSVRVTMDKRLPFDRAAVAVGPGEVKEVEVVMVAPVDPGTLPHDHKWTWRAGLATTVGLGATGIIGAVYWLRLSEYTGRFNPDTGQPLEETRKEYLNSEGQPCRLGYPDSKTKLPECAAALQEGNERRASVNAMSVATVAAGGLTVMLGVATAFAALSAPPIYPGTAEKTTAAVPSWTLVPAWSPNASEIALLIRF